MKEHTKGPVLQTVYPNNNRHRPVYEISVLRTQQVNGNIPFKPANMHSYVFTFQPFGRTKMSSLHTNNGLFLKQNFHYVVTTTIVSLMVTLMVSGYIGRAISRVGN